MKIFKTIIILSSIFVFSSCEDVLDKKPLDKVSEADVWETEALIRAYVTDLYQRFPFFVLSGSSKWLNYSDEATTATGNTGAMTQGNMSRTNEPEPYWEYGYIRDCNVFLEKIGDTPLADNVKQQLEGEVRFIRAYIYFEKMKRYGGVPLVDVVLDPFSPIDSKYTKRSKEETIADFIDAELTKAISLLSDSPTPRGKINKWTAYAFQARACLWSACIAKYGNVELDGLVGIPAARAGQFFQKASTAADAVIGSEKYSLYNKTPADKAENYRNLFLDDKDNNEIIFEKVHDGINISHGFDEANRPPSFSYRDGGLLDPTLDFILAYENIDGSADQPAFGINHLYDDGYEPFANKDPRLKASVFFQADKWQDGKVQTYEALDTLSIPDPNKVITNPNQSYKGIPGAGADSRSRIIENQSTNSGFIIKKRIDHNNMKLVNSSTNWIEFRLAEMYLIKAEAEMELGNGVSAAAALNETRKRAGITLVDQNTITLEKVRLERRSELAFETHRYWDLRRWRTAISELNSKRFQGLRIIMHYQTGKYYFIPFNCESFTRVFRQEHYYNPITNARRDNNPDLVENPIY